MIQIKSVWTDIEPRKDGLRLLATRKHGQGLSRDHYDVWMPNLAPSHELLDDYWEKRITWSVFRRRYRAELFEGGTIDARNPTNKNRGQKFTLRLLQKLAERGNVTLMCHCKKNEKHCHRHLLAEVLKGRI